MLELIAFVLFVAVLGALFGAGAGIGYGLFETFGGEWIPAITRALGFQGPLPQPAPPPVDEIEDEHERLQSAEEQAQMIRGLATAMVMLTMQQSDSTDLRKAAGLAINTLLSQPNVLHEHAGLWCDVVIEITNQFPIESQKSA